MVEDDPSMGPTNRLPSPHRLHNLEVKEIAPDYHQQVTTMLKQIKYLITSSHASLRRLTLMSSSSGLFVSSSSSVLMICTQLTHLEMQGSWHIFDSYDFENEPDDSEEDNKYPHFELPSSIESLKLQTVTWDAPQLPIKFFSQLPLLRILHMSGLHELSTSDFISNNNNHNGPQLHSIIYPPYNFHIGIIAWLSLIGSSLRRLKFQLYGRNTAKVAKWHR
jgi:hypothetical protein